MRRGKHGATPRRPATAGEPRWCARRHVVLLVEVLDQVQRMLGLFLLLPVTGEMDDLVLVAGREFTRDRQLTAG